MEEDLKSAFRLFVRILTASFIFVAIAFLAMSVEAVILDAQALLQLSDESVEPLLDAKKILLYFDLILLFLFLLREILGVIIGLTHYVKRKRLSSPS